MLDPITVLDSCVCLNNVVEVVIFLDSVVHLT